MLVHWSVSLWRQELTHATTHSQAVIHCRQEAVHQTHADRVTLLVEHASVNIVFVVVVCHKLESNGCIDEEQDASQHSSHQQLAQVGCHTLHHSLHGWESLDHIKQVDRVEHRTLEQPLHREDEVQVSEQEDSIRDNESQRSPVVLQLNCSVVEVLDH